MPPPVSVPAIVRDVISELTPARAAALTRLESVATSRVRVHCLRGALSHWRHVLSLLRQERARQREAAYQVAVRAIPSMQQRWGLRRWIKVHQQIKVRNNTTCTCTCT
jgi:hypothetical protein